MPSNLDPQTAALWALIAVSLVLLGAILTVGQLGVTERATVLVAIGTVLFAVGWRGRRHG